MLIYNVYVNMLVYVTYIDTDLYMYVYCICVYMK